MHFCGPSLASLALIFGIAAAPPAAAEPPPRAVLIIDESDPGNGAPTTFSRTLRETLNEFTPHVGVYGETLDLSRFAGARQEDVLHGYLQEKYRDLNFGVIVAVGFSALQLVNGWRSELWPHVPVLFAAIDESSAAQIKENVDISGIVMRRTIASMVAAARVMVPDLRGVAVLGGSLQRDAYRRQYLQELPILASAFELRNITGQPLPDQLRQAAALPDRTVIFYTSLFVDDAGTTYSASDSLAAIARVASRPIVVDVDSLIGFGATGGFVLDNVAYGKEMARFALRALEGAGANIPFVVGDFTKPVFDWGQLKHWGISEAGLPPGSEVRFREVGAWELYRRQIILIAIALALQTGLIMGLLHEHRRRRSAEALARDRMSELAHLDRVSVAGELSASIAHEISQPLAAMVTSASACLRFLSKPTPNLDETREALNGIISDGHRGSNVLGTMRAMFKKDPQQAAPVDINDLITEAVALVQGEVAKQSVVVRTELAAGLPKVSGNRIQLQQVILNLIMNGIEAMTSVTDRARTLRLSSKAQEPGEVLITVEDSGTGIDPRNSKRIFEALFTTKSRGMGMGLSICRSIVEAHNGRLWASPRMPHGTAFHVALPVVGPER
jgi:signal transduction histidine kinase